MSSKYFAHSKIVLNIDPKPAVQLVIELGRVPDQTIWVTLEGIPIRGLARIQKLPVENDNFSQFCQSSSYLSHYKTKQFHQSWPTSASLQDWQTGL